LPAAMNNTIAEGEAWFYCKTNAGKDKRIPVRIEHGQYSFDRSTFSKDSYELKLQLVAGGKKFFFTDFITIR
jgi:hypothetical protein